MQKDNIQYFTKKKEMTKVLPIVAPISGSNVSSVKRSRRLNINIVKC